MVLNFVRMCRVLIVYYDIRYVLQISTMSLSSAAVPAVMSLRSRLLNSV
jgi:hypothetical protein